MMILQELCNSKRILRVAGYPQVKGLEAEDEEPGIEWTKDRTGIFSREMRILKVKATLPNVAKLPKVSQYLRPW